MGPDPEHALINDKEIPTDIWTVRSWGLGHHTAILTKLHHNAKGAITWVII